MNDTWKMVTSKRNLFDFKLKELYDYRDLIFLFVKRTFVSRYKQTILGPLWAIVQPLLTTVVFTVVFGSLAGLTISDSYTVANIQIPGFVFYLSGTVCWTFFSGCLTETSNTFITNSAIMGKVYFPRLVMPVSTIFSQLISFVIQFVMFFVVWLFYVIKGGTDIQLSPYIFLFPFLTLQIGILGMGFGTIISSLTTKYRDLAMLVTFGVQLWQYATPVAYGISLIPEQYIGVYMLNPMTTVIVTFRYAFFGIGYFNLFYYLLSWGMTIVVLLISIVLFNRVERTFMDTI